jgi:hypothetical protein
MMDGSSFNRKERKEHKASFSSFSSSCLPLRSLRSLRLPHLDVPLAYFTPWTAARTAASVTVPNACVESLV